MTTTPWVIIGCGKGKRPHPAPAADLYTGSYIRNAVAWARSVTDDDHILILSAKHGLIRGTRTIEPYNVSFLGQGRPVRLATIGEQADQLGLCGPIITLAGQEYRKRLRAATRGRVTPVNPFYAVLDRLGVNHQTGYQAQQFKRWHGRVPDETNLSGL